MRLSLIILILLGSLIVHGQEPQIEKFVTKACRLHPELNREGCTKQYQRYYDTLNRWLTPLVKMDTLPVIMYLKDFESNQTPVWTFGYWITRNGLVGTFVDKNKKRLKTKRILQWATL